MALPLTRLEVRNFRCFADSTDTSIDLGGGFTAFVGQNNSGKSSLLRLFFELRNIWSYLGNNGNFIGLLRGGRQDVSYQGILDTSEIFTDSNDRPLQLVLHFPRADSALPYPLSQFQLLCKRDAPQSWHAEAHYGVQKKRPVSSLFPSGSYSSVGENVLANSHNQPVLDCSDLFNFASAFHRSMYIGPFRNAINEGAARYYDIDVGSGFVQTWHNWKAGDSKLHNLAINKVTEDIRHIFGFNSLEINAAASLKTLNLVIDKRPFKLNEVGAGISQFVVVLANAMIRQPSVILIDEPELNLHPSLQIDFLTTLASYARESVVFATHSLGLARAVAERIYTFQRSANAIKVTRFEQTPNIVEFLGEMSFAGYRELGCDRILLVEGVHEVKTMHQFLRKMGKDHKVVVIPLGGDQLARGGVELELSELLRLSRNVYALVDSERVDSNSPMKAERAAFEGICKRLGIQVCVTERRAIENYLPTSAIKTVKGEKYSALLPYQNLDAISPAWAKHESWKIAREMNLSDIADTDVGRFLASI